jgi:hypothetical protein
MDTPAIPMPKDERERQMLDKLAVIRDNLLLLKRDRTKYIRTQDVMVLHDQLVEQVKQLNEIRKGEHKAENRCTWGMARQRMFTDTDSYGSGQGSRELLPAHLPILYDHRTDDRSASGVRAHIDHQAGARPPNRSEPLLPKGSHQHIQHPRQAGRHFEQRRRATLTISSGTAGKEGGAVQVDADQAAQPARAAG